MLRRLYQYTLVALQLALAVLVAPPLANALQRGLALGAFPEGGLAIVQGASAFAAIGGAAVALVFPLLALLRHRQRGRARFTGLPRWAVVLAVAGGSAFTLGAVLSGAVALAADNVRLTMLLTARPVLNAGLALMAAGVLCAELLRRSVGVPRVVVLPDHVTAARIEVTHPPELATHAT